MRAPQRTRLATASLAFALAGCASKPETQGDALIAPMTRPSTVTPRDASEEKLLARLDGLEAGRSTQIDGSLTVMPEATYEAASGQPCRWLDLRRSGGNERRLACRVGERWTFVPDVFSVGADKGGDDPMKEERPDGPAQK